MNTQSWRGYALLWALLWAAAAGPAPATRAQGSTAVRVLPANGTYAVGAIVPVEVHVTDVEGLYGAGIELSFDPARLQVLDANPGVGGVQVMPRNDLLATNGLIIQSVSNITGTVSYAVTQIGETPSASGSGAIFSFSVQMLSEGLADVEITLSELSDKDGDPIAAEAHDAGYVIGTPFKLYVPYFRR